MHPNVKVTSLTAEFTNITVTPHYDAVAVVDSRGDVDGDFASIVGDASSVALDACAVDAGSDAAASGTFADLLKVTEQRSLRAAYLTATVTCLARRLLAARFTA